jgi:hypothetical protein
MKTLALLPCLLMATLAGPAAAQTNGQTGQAPAQSTPCQAQPQDGNGQQQPKSNNDSLSETLDPCDGVLQPPPTGDEGIAAPAPDEGKTPVIKPDEVPVQPPKQ